MTSSEIAISTMMPMHKGPLTAAPAKSTQLQPKEDPKDPLRASFQQDLKIALLQQRCEQERSLNNFFITFATMCERSGVSGPLIADTLREVVLVGDVNVPNLQQVHEGAPVKDRGTSKRTVSPTVSEASTEDHSNESIIDDNQIKHLSFMSQSGEISQQPSAMERACGPKLAIVKEHMKSPFERCQPRTGRCASFVDGLFFKSLTMGVIVLNFVYIILGTDYKAQHLHQESSSTMVALGYAFTTFYILELCLLMFVHGKQFFVGPEMGWNFFDSAIVLVAIIDILMAWLGIEGFNMSFLRVLRFFKISRVLRMFSALRTFKEIRIMVDALVGCLSIFLFCTGLMMIFLSVFAIFFVQGVAELLESEANLDAGLVLALKSDWCSVSNAMVQLFMAITGGADWGDVYNVVKEVGGMHAFLFLFFVAFYYIAFFNVITSVFCEKAMSLATPTTSELIAKRIEKEHRDASELMALLRHSLNDEACTTMNAQQVSDFVNDPEVELYFDVRGLKSSSAHKLFRMLCELHCAHKIQIGEFVSTLVKLDGAANSIDAHCLQVRQSHGLQQMMAMQKEQSEEMAMLRDILEGNPTHAAPIATEGNFKAPLLSHGVDSPFMPKRFGKQSSPSLPALAMMNETLKVVKQVVKDSMGFGALGDETLKVVRQLVPSCWDAASPEKELSFDTQLGMVSSVFAGNASASPSNVLLVGKQDVMHISSVQKTICNELSEMRQTLEEIQQTMPSLSQALECPSERWSAHVLREAKLTQSGAGMLRPPSGDIDEGIPSPDYNSYQMAEF